MSTWLGFGNIIAPSKEYPHPWSWAAPFSLLQAQPDWVSMAYDQTSVPFVLYLYLFHHQYMEE